MRRRPRFRLPQRNKDSAVVIAAVGWCCRKSERENSPLSSLAVRANAGAAGDGNTAGLVPQLAERRSHRLSRARCEQEVRNIFVFGSAFPVERYLRMYDRGMDAEKHDMVITAIADLDETLAFLQRIAPTVVEPSYEHGTVWRIPSCLTERGPRRRSELVWPACRRSSLTSTSASSLRRSRWLGPVDAASWNCSPETADRVAQPEITPSAALVPARTEPRLRGHARPAPPRPDHRPQFRRKART